MKLLFDWQNSLPSSWDVVEIATKTSLMFMIRQNWRSIVNIGTSAPTMHIWIVYQIFSTTRAFWIVLISWMKLGQKKHIVAQTMNRLSSVWLMREPRVANLLFLSISIVLLGFLVA